MNLENIIRRPLTIKANSSIDHSLADSVPIGKTLKSIEFPKIGQFHFSSLYKPLVNIVLEIISFIILIPVLLICCIVLLATGKFRAFALRSYKKERKKIELEH